MTKKILFASVFCLAATPVSAQVPSRTPERPLRITVAPVVGYGFTTTITGSTLFGRDGLPQQGDFEYESRGGPVTGLTGEYLLRPNLSVMGAALFERRGNTFTQISVNGDLISRLSEGSNLFTGRLGARWELRETDPSLQIHHPRAAVYGGVAGVYERQAIDPLNPAVSRTFLHPAFFAGVDGELPTPARRVTLRFGVDDTYVLWKNTGIERVFNRDLTAEFGTITGTAVSAHNSHSITAKASLAFHF